MTAQAFFSKRDGCWYVPVAAEIWREAQEGKLQPVEPVRVEIRDGQVWITRLAHPTSSGEVGQ